MNNEFNKTAIIIALKKLFDPNGCFYITDFDQILRLAEVLVTNEERLPFSVLHCIKYVEMPEDFRRELFEKVIELFQRSPAIQLDTEQIFPSKQLAKRGILAFLGK